MNLYTETGEGLMLGDASPLELDGYPFSAQSRAQESYDLLAYRWEHRPPEGLSYTVGSRVLTFDAAPVLVLNGIGEPIGYEVNVSLTDNGVPLEMDHTRRIINPPLLPDGGRETRVQNPELAIVQALTTSILQVPA